MIVFLVYSDRQDKQKQKELADLSVKMREEQIQKEEEERKEEERKAAERIEIQKNDSFYQKLSDGFDVNILIVGDSIGAGSGSTNGNGWASLVQAGIQKKYGVKANLTNICF